MNRAWWIVVLSFCGVLFAGYLSAVKFFSKTCGLGEGCSYFLGFPTCYYGFIIFLALFLLALTNLRFKISKIRMAFLCIASLGIVFALYFTVAEVKLMITESKVYTLLLPSCAYGLVFYILVFVLAYKEKIALPDIQQETQQQ